MAEGKGRSAGGGGHSDLYRSPAVQRPTVDKVRTISKRLGFDLSEEHLVQYTESLAEGLAPYDRVYQLVEPKPPVNYPRLPGYRPSAEDNPYNAWYMKTDIRGATSGKLLNKSVAIKDNISVAGVPMMDGSKLLEGYTPEFDATVVTRVLDAGGHVVGKATCESLCISGSSFTNDTGPVTNPRDTTRTTGGSSSGCGALLAANLVDVAIGGDQGGSIRLPAAWCGVVGLKPTWGLVPYTGALSIEPAVDHLGPMARTVTNCALLLEVIAGVDGGRDQRQPPSFEVPEYSKLLTGDLTNVKVAILVESFANCEEGIERTVREAAASLIKAGAVVCDVSIPMHADGQAIWTPICTDGPYEAMFCRAGGGPSSKGFQSTSMMSHLTRSLQTRRNELSPISKLLCLTGEYLKETTNYDFYARASNLTMALTEAYDAVLKEYDVIVMPTVPFSAIKLPTSIMGKATSVSDLIRMGGAGFMVQNTSPFNATGHPAITVNAGFVESLPVGMQVVGKKWRDQDVLKIAYAWEVIRDHE